MSGVQVAQLGARREPQLLVPATPTDGGALRFVPGTPPKRAAVSPTSPAQAPAAGGSRLVHVAVHTSALPPGGTTARTQVGLVGVTGSTPLQALSHGARAGSVHSVAVDAYGIGRVRRVVLASDGTGESVGGLGSERMPWEVPTVGHHWWSWGKDSGRAGVRQVEGPPNMHQTRSLQRPQPPPLGLLPR